MFPKSFLIAYDILSHRISLTEPVSRESVINYVYKNFDCTEMFFNKIQSQLKRAGLINVPIDKDEKGMSRRSKDLIKVKDVSALQLYELMVGPYPTGEIEQQIKPILKGLSTKK